ncbi:MAG: hypothetical protein P8L24_01685 [Cytophagales bacterium]|nr:hypothetical protein [Cytophagales bacterium]
MKKTILFLSFFLFVNFCFSQQRVVWLTYHDPVDGKSQELSNAIKDKTQKFNQEENGTQLYTYQIMAGPRQGQFLRVGLGPTWADFDNNSNMSKEMDYWRNNVMPYIKSNSGREYFVSADEASYDVSIPGSKTMGFVLHYNVAAGKADHFWKVRRNVVKAIKESGEDISLAVWSSVAGGPLNHVIVTFAQKDFEDFGNANGKWANVSKKYDEMYGSGSWKTDWDLFNESLEMWGNSTELTRFLPELSSPVPNN